LETNILTIKKVSNADKVRSYLSLCGYKPKDIAAFTGNDPSTVRAVLCGSSKSKPIRTKIISLLNFNNPGIAKIVEDLWPEGERLAA